MGVTRRNHHRRVVRLVARALGQGPDEGDGSIVASWSDRAVVITCTHCATWWVSWRVIGSLWSEYIEVPGLRLTRRARRMLALVKLHEGEP